MNEILRTGCEFIDTLFINWISSFNDLSSWKEFEEKSIDFPLPKCKYNIAPFSFFLEKYS